MPTRRPNIFRSAWRFFEILLFFGISVLGFGLLFKTSTFGSRSKEKVRQQHAATAAAFEATLLSRAATLQPECLVLSLQEALSSSVIPTHAEQTKPGTRTSAVTTGTTIIPQAHPALTRIPAFRRAIALPANLLQENPVLLI
jgi:hypothetical protein